MRSEKWSERLVRKVVREGARRRSLASFAALSVGDFFIPALPTQTTVIALALLQPRRAAWIVGAFSLAAAMGVVLMAVLLGMVDGYAQRIAADIAPDAWQSAADLLVRHGVWIVLAASIFPTPPRILVAAALLAGLPWFLVMLAVFLGKATWFGIVVALLVKMPGRLHRVPWFGRKIKQLQEMQNAKPGG